jgi:hypothetical protein
MYLLFDVIFHVRVFDSDIELMQTMKRIMKVENKRRLTFDNDMNAMFDKNAFLPQGVSIGSCRRPMTRLTRLFSMEKTIDSTLFSLQFDVVIVYVFITRSCKEA